MGSGSPPGDMVLCVFGGDYHLPETLATRESSAGAACKAWVCSWLCCVYCRELGCLYLCCGNPAGVAGQPWLLSHAPGKRWAGYAGAQGKYFPVTGSGCGAGDHRDSLSAFFAGCRALDNSVAGVQLWNLWAATQAGSVGWAVRSVCRNAAFTAGGYLGARGSELRRRFPLFGRCTDHAPAAFQRGGNGDPTVGLCRRCPQVTPVDRWFSYVYQSDHSVSDCVSGVQRASQYRKADEFYDDLGGSGDLFVVGLGWAYQACAFMRFIPLQTGIVPVQWPAILQRHPLVLVRIPVY